MNYSPDCDCAKFNKIMIDVTDKCNLECAVCYRANNPQPDPDFSLLQGLAAKYRGKIISLCGGEPTLRKDLPEIIRLFSKRNTVFLITNGIRLTDYGYLNKLKASGLRYISFSFNGLSDEVYNKINSQALCDLKLQALNNIKRSGIRVILSVLVVKGLNEKQLGATLKYCLENRGFIEELRIRTMVPVSKYLSTETYTVADLLDIFCRETSINKQDILKEASLKKLSNDYFGKEIFTQRSCSLDFHLKRQNNRYLPVGRALGDDFTDKGKINRAGLLWRLFKVYGARMLVTGFLKSRLKYEKRPWIHNGNIFKIGLRSWPTGQTANLQESQNCQTGYYLDGRVLPFCYAIALKAGAKT